jgi:hypothetical protein
LQAVNAGDERQPLSIPFRHILERIPNDRNSVALSDLFPYKEIKGYKIILATVKRNDSHNTEAVSVPGADHLLTNPELVWAELKHALGSAASSDSMRTLIEKSLTAKHTVRRCNVYLSTADKSVTGGLVSVLGMLARLLENSRDEYVVNTHIFVPRLDRPDDQQDRQIHKTNTLTILTQLALLIDANELTIPITSGNIHLVKRHTARLLDNIFVHEPLESDIVESSYYHLSRVAHQITCTELFAFSDKPRCTDSISTDSAHLNLNRKPLVVWQAYGA